MTAACERHDGKMLRYCIVYTLLNVYSGAVIIRDSNLSRFEFAETAWLKNF